MRALTASPKLSGWSAPPVARELSRPFQSSPHHNLRSEAFNARGSFRIPLTVRDFIPRSDWLTEVLCTSARNPNSSREIPTRRLKRAISLPNKALGESLGGQVSRNIGAEDARATYFPITCEAISRAE